VIRNPHHHCVQPTQLPTADNGLFLTTFFYKAATIEQYEELLKIGVAATCDTDWLKTSIPSHGKHGIGNPSF
jgi:hypothetical protein